MWLALYLVSVRVMLISLLCLTRFDFHKRHTTRIIFMHAVGVVVLLCDDSGQCGHVEERVFIHRLHVEVGAMRASRVMCAECV